MNDRVASIRAQLSHYDYLLPGDWIPEPPTRRNWYGRKVPINITHDMLVWAGKTARARVLMDLDAIMGKVAKR